MVDSATSSRPELRPATEKLASISAARYSILRKSFAKEARKEAVGSTWDELPPGEWANNPPFNKLSINSLLSRSHAPYRIVNIYQLNPQPIHTLELPELAEEAGLLDRVPANIVQSIRAFRVQALQAEAVRLGHHFLYAYCGTATTKQQVVARLAEAFHFPRAVCKTAEDLSACLTRQSYQAGPQPGFLVVLEQLPHTPRFDREARETLLDVFRDGAEFWANKKVAFRVFYSFC